MYYTAHHHDFNLPNTPVDKWDTKLMVDFLFSAVDTWHLEVADRCINGWKTPDGVDRIAGIYLNGTPANYIVDSGWAVLQITLNYFEVIAYFKLGPKPRRDNKELFEWGFFNVFPDFANSPIDVIGFLWYGLRVMMYHGDPAKTHYRNGILLFHGEHSPSIYTDEVQNLVVIDPHRFVPELRQHFSDYCHQLVRNDNPDQTKHFIDAFIEKYK